MSAPDIDYLNLAIQFEEMTVGQIRAALDGESAGTLLPATKLFRSIGRDEVGEKVGQLAMDMSSSLRHIARHAAASQPTRNLKVAKVIERLAWGHEKVASLVRTGGEPSPAVSPPASLADAIESCIELAVCQSLYCLAEVLTELKRGIDGDAGSMVRAYSSLDAMAARFNSISA